MGGERQAEKVVSLPTCPGQAAWPMEPPRATKFQTVFHTHSLGSRSCIASSLTTGQRGTGSVLGRGAVQWAGGQRFH